MFDADAVKSTVCLGNIGRLPLVEPPPPVPVPVDDDDAVCKPSGCSTGRFAANVKLTGLPKPGTSAKSGIDAKLIRGATLYWLLT